MKLTTTGLARNQFPLDTQKLDYMNTMGRCVWRLVFLKKKKTKLGCYQFWGVCISPSGLILTVDSVLSLAKQKVFNQREVWGSLLTRDGEWEPRVRLKVLAFDKKRNLALLSQNTPAAGVDYDYCVISKDPISVNLPVSTILINGGFRGLHTGFVLTATQKYGNIKGDQSRWVEVFRRNLDDPETDTDPNYDPKKPNPIPYLFPMDDPSLDDELTLTEISGFPMASDWNMHFLGQPVFDCSGRLIGLIAVHGFDSCYAVNFKHWDELVEKKPEEIRREGIEFV